MEAPIFVTGGLGFIGSNFIHKWINQLRAVNSPIVVLDNYSYAASEKNLQPHLNTKWLTIEPCNLADAETVRLMFMKYKPKFVFHFAAESHVDNSIHSGIMPFINSNIIGTVNLLEAIRINNTKMIHVSTDEVFGVAAGKSKFREDTPYNPKNPYAASKAASDHFVRAYVNTYALPVVITNCSNNYGPRQNKEKFIPTVIRKLATGEKVPVYGKGTQVRDWIHVDDHCEALIRIYDKFVPSQTYMIGANNEMKNIELVNLIANLMNVKGKYIEHVTDRPGHDVRYAIDASKIRNELGWVPKKTLMLGLKETIEWEMKNVSS